MSLNYSLTCPGTAVRPTDTPIIILAIMIIFKLFAKAIRHHPNTRGIVDNIKVTRRPILSIRYPLKSVPTGIAAGYTLTIQIELILIGYLNIMITYQSREINLCHSETCLRCYICVAVAVVKWTYNRRAFHNWLQES